MKKRIKISNNYESLKEEDKNCLLAEIGKAFAAIYLESLGKNVDNSTLIDNDSLKS
jgi:hypothetical protein